MKIFINIIFLLLVISIDLSGQEIWNYYPHYLSGTPYQDERSNNLEVLRKIIVNENANSNEMEYSETVEYLYVYHRDTEAQFLLDNLNTKIDSTLSGMNSISQWKKFYTDSYFLLLLGDQTAIHGMDSVAQYSTIKFLKFQAISRLAEINKFDYYDYVRESYLNSAHKIKQLYNLAMYGKDNRYTAEVKELFLTEINAIDKNNYLKVINYATYLQHFDKVGLIEFYENCIYETESNIRYEYFSELKLIDKDGQPKRALSILPIEPDEYFQAYYIPNPKYVTMGAISTLYLSPFFIKSLNEINLDYNPDATRRKTSYLKAYKPFNPDSTTTVETMLDTLISYTNQSYNYEWITNKGIYNSLSKKLENAKKDLEKGKANSTKNIIQAYQNEVNAQNGKHITEDGYKFLSYFSDYIIERLQNGE